LIADTNNNTSVKKGEEVDWDAPCVYPVVERKVWSYTYCPCDKSPDYHTKHPEEGMCRKEAAMIKDLWDRSKEQFFPTPVKKLGGKPWWGLGEDFIARLSTPEGEAEWKAFIKENDARKKKIADKFAGVKWDPLKMAELQEKEWGCHWRESLKDTNPMWVAYMEIGHAQYRLHGDYVKVVADGIKSKEDYKKADRLYKELGQHIDKHGHIMYHGLKKLHMLPKEKPTEAPKEGRRAARRKAQAEAEKNASKSSSSTLSRQEVRAATVTNVQSYGMSCGNDE
jgi:hypothetical protein